MLKVRFSKDNFIPIYKEKRAQVILCSQLLHNIRYYRDCCGKLKRQDENEKCFLIVKMISPNNNLMSISRDSP